jgi:hypothetical protein
MTTSAIETQGTTFAIGTVAASVSPTTYATVGEIIRFDGPGGQASVIDATHLTSTAREKLMGLPDEGQFSFSCNYVSTDSGQDHCLTARRNREKRQCKLTLSNGEIWAFDAFVLGFAISGAVDDKVTAQITLEITGPVSQI